MTPSDTPQSIPERFYKVASDILRSGMLAQAGAVTDTASLTAQLDATVTNLIPQWSAFDAPYVLKSPDAQTVATLRQQAIDIWNAWDAAGRPAIQ